MAHEIEIPAVGESIASATLGTWHKNDGDWVKAGEVVLTIETDKISTELESDRDGILRHLAGEGDELEIGAAVARIEEGDPPAQDAEAGKSAGDGEAESSGNGSEREGSGSGEAKPPSTPDRSVAEKEEVKATPVAKKIAADEDIDLDGISGTGAGGKIVKADVLAASSGSGGERDEGASAKSEEKEGDDAPVLSVVEHGEGGQRSDGGKPETRHKMSPLRRKIATHLVNAQQESAILSTFNECDMSAVMELRKGIQDDFVERHGLKLGFMSFFIKAVVDGLRAVPGLNARIEGEEIVENHYYDIGVAIGTERGLVVPVIRDCDQRSFAEIEQDIADYATRARANEIDLSDLQGGVFTLTNGGIYGSLLSTPILNPPQSGILGMHSIQERPVARDGEVVIRPMMYLAVSYDHRIVDGKEAVTFLVRVKECIENPERMLVGA